MHRFFLRYGVLCIENAAKAIVAAIYGRPME